MDFCQWIIMHPFHNNRNFKKRIIRCLRGHCLSGTMILSQVAMLCSLIFWLSGCTRRLAMEDLQDDPNGSTSEYFHPQFDYVRVLYFFLLSIISPIAENSLLCPLFSKSPCCGSFTLDFARVFLFQRVVSLFFVSFYHTLAKPEVIGRVVSHHLSFFLFSFAF